MSVQDQQSSLPRFRIESLLAARLFLEPQVVGERLYFISDLAGRLSLYAMDVGGSVPDALLPPNIALQNPHLMDGDPFVILPELGKIMVMIDQNGDENYQPMFIPLDGGIPEPVFGERFAGKQVVCGPVDESGSRAVLTVDRRTEPVTDAYLADLSTRELTYLGGSAYGNYPVAANPDLSRVALIDMITFGDHVLYGWQTGDDERSLLHGVPLDQREPGQEVPLTGFGPGEFTPAGGLLLVTALFDDQYGLGYLNPDAPDEVRPVKIQGVVHMGAGELERLMRGRAGRHLLIYNIDGCSWVYEGRFDEAALNFTIERVLCGQGELSNGVLESIHLDEAGGRYAFAFSTATSPAQLYVVDGEETSRQTNERVLGIAPDLLAPGEDASYESFDGLRISARLYTPSPKLGYEGSRPVVYYIHGGPQSQERPDFTWFSMPLIQFLTLNGFAVFVPNVRGSSGYGLAYMKMVDHDWGGQDRLDHVAAFEKLRTDPRLDMDRAGVMGRSYGGYMTLTQVGRHPDLWKAGVDMFGPYNLITFIERLPETWKTYFYLAVGHPERDRAFLVERSPSTHLHNLACPLLVIQGANDPRVVEQESRDLVAELQAAGKQVELLVFEDEGHDVIKYRNKVTVYNRITEFFKRHLG